MIFKDSKSRFTYLPYHGSKYWKCPSYRFTYNFMPIIPTLCFFWALIMLWCMLTIEWILSLFYKISWVMLCNISISLSLSYNLFTWTWRCGGLRKLPKKILNIFIFLIIKKKTWILIQFAKDCTSKKAVNMTGCWKSCPNKILLKDLPGDSMLASMSIE